ncbi:MAG: formate dehydrogenase, partial [Alphaproteobacteria bacterium]
MAAPITVYVPLDSAAVALGADEVASAIANEAKKRGADVTIVRNGSRGMHWLEPLVEVTVGGKRLGYGPVQETDVKGLFDMGFLEGKKHALSLGAVEEIPYFKNQERLIFKRCGTTDPLSLQDYEAHGGLKGLKRALHIEPKAVVEEVKSSGLRGRGGAGFPAGIKWETVAGISADQKYVVCNADEGDSGTFADRMIMEGDPFLLIEGMAIAGIATGATQGYVYLRSEYPIAARVFETALKKAREAGVLGKSVLGSGKAFELELFMGAGAYICGEESSLLNSLEGKRGEVRARPPIPAIAGLNGKPTVLNNTITFCSVPYVLAEGAAAYKNFGRGRSLGTMPFQLAGNIKRGGLVEKAFGVTLRQLAEDFGGGTRSGRPLRAIQVGGPLGAYLPQSLFDLPMDYEAFATKGAGVGH